MRIVMTLCVKNEEDVLDAQLAFHLNAGVDFVIVTDTGSTDGTLEILERYARDGVLQLHHDHSVPFDQAALVTRMARLAAKELEADWIINADADEFWWPRGESLRDVLGSVPPGYGIVRGIWRAFVPRPDDDDEPFYERMTYRLAPQAALNEPERPFRPHSKIAHRADPSVRVVTGNHDLEKTALAPLRGWYPIEVFHFPLRTSMQVSRKHEANRHAWRGRELYRQHADDVLGPLVLGEDQLAHGLEVGVLVEDTRLRDALRVLADPATGRFALPRDGSSQLALSRPSIVDDALFAVDASALGEADDIRVRRQLDKLDLRLKAVDRLLLVRIERWLRRVLRRDSAVR